jgi:hypothetical protein
LYIGWERLIGPRIFDDVINLFQLATAGEKSTEIDTNAHIDSEAALICRMRTKLLEPSTNGQLSGRELKAHKSKRERKKVAITKPVNAHHPFSTARAPRPKGDHKHASQGRRDYEINNVDN